MSLLSSIRTSRRSLLLICRLTKKKRLRLSKKRLKLLPSKRKNQSQLSVMPMLSFKKLRIKWKVKVSNDLSHLYLIQNPVAQLPGFFIVAIIPIQGLNQRIIIQFNGDLIPLSLKRQFEIISDYRPKLSKNA